MGGLFHVLFHVLLKRNPTPSLLQRCLMSSSLNALFCFPALNLIQTSCVFSLRFPCFMTSMWTSPSLPTKKSKIPSEMSPRSWRVFAQTREDPSELQIITPGTAQCLWEFSTFMDVVFTFYFKSFWAHSLEAPCLTRSPARLSCCLLHSEASINQFLKQGRFCAESKATSQLTAKECSEHYCLYTGLRLFKKYVWNEWGRREW